MPSSTYQVTLRESSKSNENDQSYKNCVIMMLIILSLCVIIIVVAFSWKKFNSDSEVHDLQQSGSHGVPPGSSKSADEGITDIPAVPSKVRAEEERKLEKYVIFPAEEAFSSPSTDFPVLETSITVPSSTSITPPTENSSETHESTNENESSISENNDEISEVTEASTFSTSKINSKDEEITTTELNIFESSPSTESQNFQEIASVYVSESSSSRSDVTPSTETSFADEKSRSTARNEDFTSLKRLLVAKYFKNESTTEESLPSDDWLDNFDTETTTERATQLPMKKTAGKSTGPQNDATEGTTEHQNYSDRENDSKTHDHVCTSGRCKQEASRIISWMNHSADPCDDFYEYACGGLEADPGMIIVDPEDRALSIIKKQMLKEKRAGKSSYFYDYYQSCMNNGQYSTDEKLDLASKIVEQVGAFYDPSSLPDDYPDITELLTNLLKRDSALLFDVTPELNEDNPQEFVLKIGPPHPSISSKILGNSRCSTGESDEDFVDLENMYENYKLCKNNTRELPSSIHEALQKLHVIKELNNTFNVSHYVHRPNMDSNYGHDLIEGFLSVTQKKSNNFIFLKEINLILFSSQVRSLDESIPLTITFFENEILMQTFSIVLIWLYKKSDHDHSSISLKFKDISDKSMFFPSENEVREAYRSKNYSTVTLGHLESQSTLLNWTQLIFGLTRVHMNPDSVLQIYFKDNLFGALHQLDSIEKSNFLTINNAIIGYYAVNLYNEIVESNFLKNLENKCLNLAASFLPREASTLYISSFTPHELNRMKRKVFEVFRELKRTMRLKFEHIDWAVEKGQEDLIKKLDDIKILIPEFFNYNEYSGNFNISDNFYFNTVIIKKKYRELIYSILNDKPNNPELLWTYFSTPFQQHPVRIYPLNLILLPLGAIEIQKLTWNNENYDYTTLANIGTLIAHEITHYFDANGIQYWNGTRDSAFSNLHDNNFTKTNYYDYINCQSQMIFHEPSEIVIPSSNQRVKFRIPPMTLNERLSDAAGVRLAYDTLVRLGKSYSELPPWLDLDIHQLFYLAYAQTHCTKAPLTASSSSFYEDPQLPSRLRIYAVAVSNKLIGEVFNCPIGSQVHPDYSCGVFPYLENQNANINMV